MSPSKQRTSPDFVRREIRLWKNDRRDAIAGFADGRRWPMSQECGSLDEARKQILS